jgi:hypothetical protein
MQNQFNRPLNFDTILGIHREAFVYRNSPGREYYDYQTLEKLDTVDYQGKKIDVVCGFQRSGDTATTSVLATFANGSPATQVMNYGKGKIVLCDFFPGIAYCKEAITTLKKSNQTSNTSGATVFPEVQRILFKKLLNLISWKPAIATSNHLVEANLLQSPKGCVVVLSNWSGRPIRNLVVSIAIPGKFNSPLSATGKVKSLKKVKNTLLVTMDIDAFDFLFFTARQQKHL